MTTADEIVQAYQLQPHVEGGYFKETYRCLEPVNTEKGVRSAATLIYFLLKKGQTSKFHKIAFEEVWLFHGGAPLNVHMIYENGRIETLALGLGAKESAQVLIPKGVIFGAESTGDFSFVSCMVSPGFDFQDFTLFSKAEMLLKYPQHQEVIRRLHHSEGA
jgi:predicted cupin superfamily sugar epimerase